MTQTFDGPATGPETPRSTPGECAVVLGGFALAALFTAFAAAAGTGMEGAGAAWLAAIGWAVASSLALALRRGILFRDWSAFRRHRPSDDGDAFDWSTKTGRYAYLRERENRLLHDDRHLR